MSDTHKELWLYSNDVDDVNRTGGGTYVWAQTTQLETGLVRYVLGTEHDRVKAQRDEMLALVKMAGNGGCQFCMGNPYARLHSSFCEAKDAAIAKAEADNAEG